MVGVSVGKFAVMVVLLQLCAEAMARPRDSVTRKGIIKKMYTKDECVIFKKAQSIDGVKYEKQGDPRLLAIKNNEYLAHLQRYVQSTSPNNGFDFMVLTSVTGPNEGNVLTGAQLIKLRQNSDLEDAIIRVTRPSGLEFVMEDQQCAFIETGRTIVSRVFDCSGDNFQAYSSL